MRRNIIKEVLNQEEKSEKSIKLAEKKYDHKLDEQKLKIRNEQEIEINQIDVEYKKNVRELKNKLEADFKKKQNKQNALLSNYNSISKKQLNSVIKKIVKVL